jgi:hypothetical protein
MMHAVVFHPEDQDVSERAREEPRIPVAAFSFAGWCGAQPRARLVVLTDPRFIVGEARR